MLPLVDLARLDPRDAAARAVNRNANLAQRAPVLSVQHLGTEDDHRTVPARRPQQPLKRLRGWLAVVVQQPDPLDPLHVRVGPGGPPGGAVLQGDRDGLAVARSAVHPEHRVLADELGQHRATAVTASGVDPDGPLDRVGLRSQRLHEPGQQSGTVVRDDDRGDGMPGLLRGS